MSKIGSNVDEQEWTCLVWKGALKESQIDLSLGSIYRACGHEVFILGIFSTCCEIIHIENKLL